MKLSIYAKIVRRMEDKYPKLERRRGVVYDSTVIYSPFFLI
jgi:hypothetical protein